MNTVSTFQKLQKLSQLSPRLRALASSMALALFGLLFVGAAPAAAAEPAVANAAPAVAQAAAYGYGMTPTSYYTLSVTIDTTMLFDGAQLIIDALGGPYMYIAGLALGAAILGAIIAAVARIRI
ncbi:MAG: hypothetical protein KDD89_00765 [Anaerolineales bacterium]|nr:hypothetical protein [Anaerolineales bacterium]